MHVPCLEVRRHLSGVGSLLIFGLISGIQLLFPSMVADIFPYETIFPALKVILNKHFGMLNLPLSGIKFHNQCCVITSTIF